MRRCLIPIVLLAVAAGGCDLVNPERPTPQPDVTVFGNLLEVEDAAAGDGTTTVRLQVGVPRGLAQARQAEGKPTPAMEKGTVAEVTVGADAVVLRGGRPVGLEAFDPGTELVVIPVSGSTRMAGAASLFVEAAYLLDFATYRRWQLPGLVAQDELPAPVEDPSRVNTAGIEESPIPVGGGRVLYFSARLRLPERPGGPWLGARRDGLADPEGTARPRVRSYRTELGADGWTPPTPVAFPGLDAPEVRVTWVADDETLCLITVGGGEEPRWIGRSQRPSPGAPWGSVERLERIGDDGASDAGYLAGSRSKLVFSAVRVGTGSDLYLDDPKQAETPQPLDPRINTPGDEWCPRVGPGNELYFCRGDRQLVLAGGSVRPVRAPGPFRRELHQAMPSGDGRWLFLVIPRYTPVELDLDLAVAPMAEGRVAGPPVPVDEWRP